MGETTIQFLNSMPFIFKEEKRCGIMFFGKYEE